MGEDCILFSMWCSSEAMLSFLLFLFFSVKQKERRDGEGGILEDWGRKRGEMEEPLTCTCLQSLRIHCTIHLLCLYCHGWGQSDQTPIRFFILPPYVSPPYALIHPRHLFFFSFFFCFSMWHADWRRVKAIREPPQSGKCQEENPHQNQVVMEIQYSPEITD